MDALSIYKEFYIGVLGHTPSYKEIDIISFYTEGLAGERSTRVIPIVEAIG